MSLCVDDQYCEKGPDEYWAWNRPNWEAKSYIQLGVELPHLNLEYGSIEHTPPSFNEMRSLRVTYVDELEQPVKVFSIRSKLHRASLNGFEGGKFSEPCQPVTGIGSTVCRR